MLFRSLAKRTLKNIELDINYDKTRIIDFDTGFQYLGYLFCKSLVIEKKKDKKVKRKFILDSTKIPESSWLTLVNFNKIKEIQNVNIEKENSFKLLHSSDNDYDKIPIYITEKRASIKIENKKLEVGFESEGKFYNKNISLRDISAVVVIGTPYFSISAMQQLSRKNIPIFFLDNSGRISFKIDNSPPKFTLWMQQAKLYNNEEFCIDFAKNIISAKIHNSYIIGKRAGFSKELLQKLKAYSGQVKNAKSLDVLRGIEGSSALYNFKGLKELIPVEWNFTGRTKFPPEDPVNAMLSFGYTILHNNITVAIKIIGLNPELSFYHRHTPYHYALASDLQEEFRYMIDALVIYIIKKNIVKLEDFICNPENELPVLMKKDFKKKYIELIERRFLTEFRPKNSERTLTYRDYFYLRVKSILHSVREGKLLYDAFKIR